MSKSWWLAGGSSSPTRASGNGPWNSGRRMPMPCTVASPSAATNGIWTRWCWPSKASIITCGARSTRRAIRSMYWCRDGVTDRRPNASFANCLRDYGTRHGYWSRTNWRVTAWRRRRSCRAWSIGSTRGSTTGPKSRTSRHGNGNGRCGDSNRRARPNVFIGTWPHQQYLPLPAPSFAGSAVPVRPGCGVFTLEWGHRCRKYSIIAAWLSLHRAHWGSISPLLSLRPNKLTAPTDVLSWIVLFRLNNTHSRKPQQIWICWLRPPLLREP